MTRVAIIGTQGLPAAYGGFETLVENLVGDNCHGGVEYTVFCSSRECPERLAEYRGAKLKYVPLASHGIQSIPYDILSMLRAIRGYDVTLVLGTSGCSFLPVFRLFNRKRLIVNIDGLEHRREKWGRAARAILRFSERMAARCADVVIADNEGIAQYVRSTYGIEPATIAYGGDHALRDVPAEQISATLDRYGLTPGDYAVTVCRIEPENNCHLILEAFSRQSELPIAFVGNWDRSDYGRALRQQYGSSPAIKMLDPVYDLDTLYALRSQARCYVHGHSAGGTNPSLVEAMFMGRPIIAYDVVYNRATTRDQAYYFTTADDLLVLISTASLPLLDGSPMRSLADAHYRWGTIASQYAELY